MLAISEDNSKASDVINPLECFIIPEIKVRVASARIIPGIHRARSELVAWRYVILSSVFTDAPELWGVVVFASVILSSLLAHWYGNRNIVLIIHLVVDAFVVFEVEPKTINGCIYWC